MKKIQKGLFIFHRDFRIVDNVGLIKASKMVDTLYVCFIFTPEQVSSANDYKSNNSIQFMIESLQELENTINKKGGNLMLFYENTTTAVKKVIDELDVGGVFFNKDYSPYALKRDKELFDLCEKKQIVCNDFEDYYLYEPGQIITSGSGEAYKKYTPFYNTVVNIQPAMPSKIHINNFEKSHMESDITLEKMFAKLIPYKNKNILVRGGRKNGLYKLSMAVKKQKDYDETRDFFKEKTTHLSAYIKYGCVSIREVYHTFKKVFGKNHGLIRELIWREFFAHVLYAYPEVIGRSYQKKYRNLQWRNNVSEFNKWKTGKTGVPMVDACMRELNETGYMHNRGRMTVASFLIKTLLIDWRKGEKYFAQQLTDYDVASNNGNWQGISGTGVDMKPYFRDMNPWIQSAKFDKEAIYIKKWLPELEDVPSIDIHKWDEKFVNYKHIKYPKPIVDYSAQKEEMLVMYKNA